MSQSQIQMLISYDVKELGKSEVKSYVKKVGKYGSAKVVVIIGEYRKIKTKLHEELVALRDVYMPQKYNWVILFPASEEVQILNYMKECLPDIDWQTVALYEKDDLSFWQEIMRADLSGVISMDLSSLHGQLRVQYIKENQVDGIKEDQMNDELVTQIWNKDHVLRSILLHSYLIQQSDDYTTELRYSYLKNRVGLASADYDARLRLLQTMGVLEKGDGVTLSVSAFSEVENLVQRDYLIGQYVSDLKGAEFLNISFDGRQRQSKSFYLSVRNSLVKNLIYIREIELDNNPYVFEVFLPGKWFGIFVVKSSSSHINEQIISLALAFKEQMNKWLVMKSNFAVVVGSVFSKKSIELAERLNISLIESSGYLKINNALSALTHDKSILAHDYIPLLFSNNSGLLNTDLVILNFLNAMEDK